MEITQVIPKIYNRHFTQKQYKSCKTTANSTETNENYITPNGYYNRISFGSSVKQPDLSLSKYSGCIIGGALGDALGAPVEFYSLNQIKEIYGKDGIRIPEKGMSGKAEITDDTQMVFFTADGLIKSLPDNNRKNFVPNMSELYESYRSWYRTQQEEFPPDDVNGWVSHISGLYRKRNPGSTCLKSISRNIPGSPEHPVNNSKGNGGLMRVCPAGLIFHDYPKIAFEVGMRSAALTHGNPTGYLSSGFLASMIAYIINGENLNDAIDKSLIILEKYDNNEETIKAVQNAKELANTNIDSQKAISTFRGGWTADDALGIAIYSALKSGGDFKKALIMSVNHDGDSDSTGAITGNIMGAVLGVEALPKEWLKNIELKNELFSLADDLYKTNYDAMKLKEKYPYNKGRIPMWYDSKDINNSDLRISSLQFYPEDIEKMKTMSASEKIKFKQQLIRERRFIV